MQVYKTSKRPHQIMKTFLFCLLTLCPTLFVSAQGTLYVGNVNEDDHLSSIQYTGYAGVCSAVSSKIIQKYAGSEVIGLRFALGNDAVTNVRAFLSADPTPSTPQNDLAAAEPQQVVAGWNEVTFPQPYTLQGTEEELYVGYYLSCASTEERPVLVGDNTSNYGLLVYEKGEYGTGWYDYSATGDLAIQLVLRGGNLSDYDVALKGLSTNARYYAATEEKMHMAVNLVNTGTKPLPGLTLNLTFDDQTDVGGDIQVDEEITGSMQLPLELPLNTFGLTAGRHTLTVRIKEAKGGVTLSTTGDEERAATCTFYIYQEAVNRTNSLLEVYTSNEERYNATFMAPLEEFLTTHPTVVPVYIYDLDQDEAPAYAQELATAAGVRTLPSFGFNRTATPGNEEFLYDYSFQPTAEDFAELLDYLNEVTPAFATISLEGKYDTNSRLLTLTAKGTRNADFRNIFNYGALTIYLTENDVNGRNHVLRKIVTSNLGNVISWNENGGLGFSRDYRLTADASWDINKMQAVAFISKMTSAASRHDNMDVTNTTVLPLSTLLPNAVHDLTSQDSAQATTTYDLAGRRMATASKPGIYVRGGKKVVVR